MDNTIKPEQYADVLRKFDRKKEHNEYEDSNNTGRTIAGSIGAETPLLVLMDIRKELSDISIRMEESNNITRDLLIHLNNARDDDAIKRDQQHKDMLAYMQQLSDSMQSSRNVVSTPSAITTPREKHVYGSSAENTYFYYDYQLKTSESVVGCILMHLYMLVSNNLGDFRNTTVDSSLFGLSEWTSTVRNLRSSDSYKLPKFSSFDVKQALDIVASTTMGRRVTLKIEHISELSNTCPTIIIAVEEMRNRIMRCPGFVPLLKAKCLATLEFPYVTMENTFNVATTDPKIPGSDALIDMVKSMNDSQKKRYVKEVLNLEKKPMAATRIVLSNKNS